MGNNPKCPSTGEYITVVYQYNEMFFSYEKEWTIDTHYNMDELKNNYAERKKLDKRKKEYTS